MKTNLYILLMGIVFAALLSSVSRATTWIVDDDYAPPWNSIQHAIVEAALSGDEIQVEPGIYEEAINFLGKAIWLYSSSGPEVTTIDAAGENLPAVTCKTSEASDTILEGFTITGGTGRPRSGPG